jgi:precorrin-2 dehydrogenase/sirohydrochlorin ferrochelatase
MIIDLDVNGKTVLIIGSGTEVLRKIRGLLYQNCNIIVITNRLNKHLRYLSQQGKIKIDKTTLNNISSTLDSYKNPYLVLAATNNKLLNRQLVEKGWQMRSIWIRSRRS